MTTVFSIDNAGNVGIGTTVPSSILTFGGTAARTIAVDRHTTTNTAGSALTVQAGGATSAATDKNGGNLVLASGIGTGMGSSSIQFQTPTAAGSTGTADNAPSTKMTITGTGNVGIGTTNPATLLSLAADTSTTLSLNARGASARPAIVGTVARGTQASPTATQNGDWLLFLSGQGYGATTFGGNQDALIALTAAENFTDTAHGTFIGFETTPLGTMTRARRMTIAADGNVGIGSLSPQAMLDVNGTVRASSFVSTGGSSNFSAQGINNVSSLSIGTTAAGTDIFFGSGANRTMSVQSSATAGNSLTVQAGGTSATTGNVNGGNLVLSSGAAYGTGTSQIQFNTASGGAPATSMTIAGNGNVGIGTTAPVGKFDIYGATSPEFYLRDASSGLRIVPAAGANFIQSGSAGPAGSADLHFANIAAANTWMTIKANGKVGVGSTSPVSLLANTSTNSLDTASIGVNLTGGLTWSTSGAGYVETITNTDATASNRNALLLKTAATDAGSYLLKAESGGTNRLTVTAAGNVGIGNTSPSELLQASANSNTPVRINLVNSNTGSGAFSEMRVNSDVNNFKFGVGSSGNSSAIGGGGAGYVGTDSAYPLQVYTSATERMRITSSGNVGIGMTSPTAPLDVLASGGKDVLIGGGATTGSELKLTNTGTNHFSLYNSGNNNLTFANTSATNTTNTTGSALMSLTSTGNLGIGSTSPAAKLDVAGDIKVSGVLAEKSVTFTPTTVGWYRLVSQGQQSGGTIKIISSYDNQPTDVEFQYYTMGYGQDGSIQETRFAQYNGGVVSQARVSNNNGGMAYLDIYISSATTPGPVTVYGYGPAIGGFVASPVVGAVAGANNVSTLTLGHGFRTTNLVQASSAALQNSDGSVRSSINPGNGNFLTIEAYNATNTVKYPVILAPYGGNVGINTTAPASATLHVSGNGLIGSNASGGANVSLQSGGIANTRTLAVYYQSGGTAGSSSGDFSVVQSTYQGVNQTPLVLNPYGGSVGIGTTSPKGKLDIVGGALVLNGGLNNTSTRPGVAASRITGEIAGYSAGSATADDGFLRLSAGGGTSASTKAYIDLSGWSTQADMNNNLVFGTANTERMRINSRGNVGIGTTNPDAKLKVQGGQIVADQVTVSGSTVDFHNGNLQILTAVGSNTITLNNLVDGGAYTLIVADTTSRTYTFQNCAVPHFTPANGATVANKMTIYSILKVTITSTTHCFISWVTNL